MRYKTDLNSVHVTFEVLTLTLKQNVSKPSLCTALATVVIR